MGGRGLIKTACAIFLVAAAGAGSVLGAGFLAGCANPLRSTLRMAVADYYRSRTTVSAGTASLADGSGIDKASAIVIVFPEGMKADKIALSGDLATESSGGTWSTTTNANDTLTISPRTVWGAGSSRSLVVSFIMADASAVPTISLSLGILSGVVYVRARDGLDENPGTADRPKRSIKAGVELAAKYYPSAEVHVAGGSYPVNNQEGTSVTMAPGISMLGGYDPADWETRDTSRFISEIKDLSASPSKSYVYAVSCGTGLTQDTILDGFTIKGGGNDQIESAFAIRCASSSPTISGNVCIGGYGSLSVGIAVIGGGPRIVGNDIDGGGGVDSIGIIAKNCPTGPLVAENTIRGGSGTNSCVGFEAYGDSIGGCVPILRGNSIVASVGMAKFAIGIWNENSDSLIEGNTIRAGRFMKAGIGIQDWPMSRTIIRNNDISGGEGYLGQTESTAAGIDIEGDRSTIVNNTICGGWVDPTRTGIAAGIMLAQSGSPGSTSIENNVLFTLGGNTRTGILERALGTHPGSLANNDIFDCPFSLMSLASGTDAQGSVQLVFLLSIGDFAPYAWAQDNLSVDPLFVVKSVNSSAVGADWHLQAGSPLMGAGKTMTGFSTDRDGKQRSGGWTIGAYQ